MASCRTLCIFTTLLGNKATAQRLVDALKEVKGVDPTFVLVTVDDHKTYSAPRWARLTDAWEGRYVARRKVGPLRDQQFDALLVNSWEFVIEFQDLARRMPAAALMDCVPATINAQLLHRGQASWRRALAHQLQHVPFKRAARHFRAFLPMGSDAVDALDREYGVSRERCFVTYAPQNLDLWTPGDRVHAPPFKLLFAGNDFLRKGGDFLLRLYAGHLSRDFTLTIASRDPGLEGRQLPEGVTWLRDRNREDLLEIYRASDLFVFPTQQDYMPQVLAEALAAGVPCMANDIGGIRDLVRDGDTGFLMRPEAPLQDWAERLHYLQSHPDERNRLAAGARRFAEENLGIERFTTLISTVMKQLCSGV